MSKTMRKNSSDLSYADQLQAFKEEVRERYPIDRAVEDLAGVRFVQRAGATSRMACCPFHQEKTPSFSVNTQEGYYCCFGGGCGAKGDLFSFIMEHENVSFMEALQIAGRNAGVTFPTPDGRAYRPSKKGSGATRRVVQPVDRRTHPGDLLPHGLIPVPDRVRTPSANSWASGWHEGNSKKPAATKNYKPRMVHEYRNGAGELLLSILRVEMMNEKRGNGKPGKFFIPMRLSKLPDEADDKNLVMRNDRIGWIIKGVPQGHLRPVYGMEMVPQWRSEGGTKILVVEGEKTADAARRLLSGTPQRADWIVFSPLGGGNSALYADWSDLADACKGATGPVEVVVWPDADTPIIMRKTQEVVDRQKAYATDIVNGIGYALTRAEVPLDQVSFSRIAPIEDVASGWDLADAEQEGWSGQDLIQRAQVGALPVQADKAFLRADRPAREEADVPVPFDQEDFCVDIDVYDAFMSEMVEQEINHDKGADMSQSVQEKSDNEDLLPIVEARPDRPLIDEMPPVRDLAEEDVIAADDEGHDMTFNEQVVRLRNNRYFRCLGYMEGVSYFLSLDSGQVFDLNPMKMKPVYLYHLAPAAFWSEYFPGVADRNGVIKTDWDAAVDTLIQATNETGQFDPYKQVGQGTWFDHNEKIVFNSGRGLWVEGKGPVNIKDYVGEKNYVVGQFCEMPDFDNPFPADAPEIWALLDIIKAVHWAPESRKVSILNMFGWLAIGPICGVLPWRPHLYLSGERGVGKSWIINNIIKRIFRSYGANVKADSTESGLRNLLNGRAFPLIFDEAEGETLEDRQRMAKIIRLARHSATPGDSIVAQGISGGGGQRQYAIASTFLMCSITPQLSTAADSTRFGRAHLVGGLSHYDFAEQIRGPAKALLTDEFSGRFMARMITRAKDMKKVSERMQEGLSTYNIEQRLVDVYSTYLAGAWLLLRDDVPESGAAAMQWAKKTFDMVDGLMSQISEISEDKDHSRLFQALLSHDVRVESMSIGNRGYTIGELIETIEGRYEHDDALPTGEAVRALRKIGIRLGRGTELVDDKGGADSLFIHRKSTQIEDILKNTPYAKSYVDVMTQAKGVRKDDKMVRFGGASSRIVIVPLANLSLGEDETNDRTEPARDE